MPSAAPATCTPPSRLARLYAGQAEHRGHFSQLDRSLAIFLVFPFTHSESLVDQERSVALSAAIGPERVQQVDGHHAIIRRFGRFPHRNAVLGRVSTVEEETVLAAGGFAG